MTRIKICGCMRPEDAAAAARAGADMVGMIFVEGVRRQVSVEEAVFISEAVRAAVPETSAPLTEPFPPSPKTVPDGWFERWAGEISRRLSLRRPLVVGVFANQPLDFINEVVETCDLDLVQFSGDEPCELALGVIRPVLKSVKVTAGADAKAVLSGLTPETIALPLLEPLVPGAHGGSGVVMDWTVAREISALVPIVLSGGLNPDNVAGAIRTVKPWAVDVSSGVETDGQKDPTRIYEFVSAVRGA
jgi:phosphoribosylanthranilate isomerase